MTSETNNSNRSILFNGAFLHNFGILLKKVVWLPIVLTILAGAFFYVKAVRDYRPVYESRAVFAVSSMDIGSHSTYATYYNSSAAQKLTTTFPYVLNSDIMQQLMREELGRSPSGINVTSMASSSLFVMSSTDSSPKRAYETLCALVKVYPQAAANVIGSITLNVVEEPFLPTEPLIKNEPWIPALEAAGVALLLSFVLIGFFAYLRKTVHSSDDLRMLVNVPCLCNLPTVQMKRRTSDAAKTIAVNNKHLPQSYQDAVRSLRFHLKKELNSQPAKVILVTSTLPNEGKSTVSANLALSLAEQQKKVLLIDADLRKPTLKKFFHITEESEGLTELLTNDSPVVKPVQVPNSSLLLLAGTKVAEHPQSLLSSKKMAKIISSLREQMDYIILDTPPAGLLSDAATLSSLIDAAIYVVRQDFANRSTILDSAQMLSNMDIRFIGTVLNFTARGTTQHGYGYGSGYGYGGTYGYGNRYGYGYSYGGYYGKKYGYSADDSESSKHSKKKSKNQTPDLYIK